MHCRMYVDSMLAGVTMSHDAFLLHETDTGANDSHFLLDREPAPSSSLLHYCVRII